MGESWLSYTRAMVSQLITERMAGGTSEIMAGGGGWNSMQVLRREFRRVDTLTGTPEADNFKLKPPKSPGFGTQTLVDNLL